MLILVNKFDEVILVFMPARFRHAAKNKRVQPVGIGGTCLEVHVFATISTGNFVYHDCGVCIDETLPRCAAGEENGAATHCFAHADGGNWHFAVVYFCEKSKEAIDLSAVGVNDEGEDILPGIMRLVYERGIFGNRVLIKVRDTNGHGILDLCAYPWIDIQQVSHAANIEYRQRKIKLFYYFPNPHRMVFVNEGQGAVRNPVPIRMPSNIVIVGGDLCHSGNKIPRGDDNRFFGEPRKNLTDAF